MLQPQHALAALLPEVFGGGWLADGTVMNERVPQAPAAPVATTVPGGQTYTLMYSGIEFHAAPSSLTWSVVGNGLYSTTASNPDAMSFKLPLGLPNGAQVTEIVLYAVDSDATNNVTLNVIRTAPASGSTQEYLYTFGTTNSVTNTTVQAITLSGSPLFTVDNTTKTYFLRYQPSASGLAMVLYGARVKFTVPSAFLPAVFK